jgi:2-furoyl-CoA dehydrogenase FAD binding subunit
MTTAVAADELVTGVRFPTAGAGEGFGFAEIARRHGDFALAGVAVRVRTVSGGLRDATLAAFGVSDRPVVRDVTDLLSSGVTEADLRPATDALAGEVVDTAGDAHGSTAYRARLLGVLAARELARAHSEAVA